MIIDSKEWRMVPVEATEEMNAAATDADKEYTRRVYGEGHPRMQLAGEDHYAAMLAAAPAPPVVEVTDEVAKRVNDEWDRLVMRRDCSPDAACGYDMIAAVQSILGPTLGMVTREEMARAVEAAYRESVDTLNPCFATADTLWNDSAARRRLEKL